MPYTPAHVWEQNSRHHRSYITPRKLNCNESTDEENSCNRMNTSCNRKVDLGSKEFNACTGSSLQQSASLDSEGGSELSVSELKGWLNDFGQKNRNHVEKVTQVGHVPPNISLSRPTRPKQMVKSSRSSHRQPITRGCDQIKDPRKGPTMTPVRFKTRQNAHVQATDTGYASVKELSAWLADDPTVNKSSRGCVRRGINVIKKSKMFDKELENVILEECDEQVSNNDFDGRSAVTDSISVHDKQQWLSGGFRGNLDSNGSYDDFDRKSAVTELVSVQDKKKWLSGAFGTEESRSEMNEDRSCASVCDKRQWLQTAFKKGSQRMLDAKRSQNFDAATPAKQKWKERRRSSQNSSFHSATTTPNRKPPTPVNASNKKEECLQEQSSVIDSETSFDFRAARQLLINKKW
mmetsp:Transcript_427/g.610  ORF Transcript_427/g.610 Transcript_427/m.610 type:complete len:406 (-) Transcript_427:139-1356(-)